MSHWKVAWAATVVVTAKHHQSKRHKAKPKKHGKKR